MNFRNIQIEDKKILLDMMLEFYHSPAVLEKASTEVLQRNIDDCISQLPFVEGFVFEKDNVIIGYGMIALSYSTEFGGICIWIEDVYITKMYRGQGIATKFFNYLENIYEDKIVRFRIEATKNNDIAINTYHKWGFKNSDYIVMNKEY